MSEVYPQPDAVTARYAQGILLCRRGRYAEAAAELEGLLRRPDTIGYVARSFYALTCRALGVEALRAGDLAGAERRLRAAAEVAGQARGPSDDLIGLYARGGRREDCLREMDKAVERDGGRAADHARLALAQWQAGRREEAYLTLGAAFRRFGGEGVLHLHMGLCLAAEGRYDEARASLARAVEADCGSPDAHYYFALVAAAQQDVSAAVRAFQRALDLRPGDLMIAYQLSLAALAAAQRGQNVTVRLPEPAAFSADGRLAELAEYVAAEPDSLEALLFLPEDEGDAELAALVAGVANLALVSHPTYADLHLVGSLALARLGQTEAAIEQAREALALNPSYVRARLHLAGLCERTGRVEEAVTEVLRAVADGADWPDAHLRAGELLRRCGRVEEARQHLQRALQLNEGYAPAAKALASLAA